MNALAKQMFYAGVAVPTGMANQVSEAGGNIYPQMDPFTGAISYPGDALGGGGQGQAAPPPPPVEQRPLLVDTPEWMKEVMVTNPMWNGEGNDYQISLYDRLKQQDGGIY
jgi:hypothetical protein